MGDDLCLFDGGGVCGAEAGLWLCGDHRRGMAVGAAAGYRQYRLRVLSLFLLHWRPAGAERVDFRLSGAAVGGGIRHDLPPGGHDAPPDPGRGLYPRRCRLCGVL